MRAVLVALLVATPSLLLASHSAGASEMAMLLAIGAGVLTYVEYHSYYPSFVEFRDAPPINRIRFVSLFAMLFFLSIICKHLFEPTNLTAMVSGISALIGDAIDFPYSPVRLMILMLPSDSSAITVETVRSAAGLAYLITLVTVFIFWVVIRVFGWPTSTGAFNVWVNMPLFDPTGGGDVVARLYRDARINIIVGVLLPFVIPAVVELASGFFTPMSLTHPQVLVWTISTWAFLPASMTMRGLALLRIADLIEEKRRRTYANAEALQTV